MTAPQIVVGHNVRQWTTFRVLDATPDELAILAEANTTAEASQKADELASAMLGDNRLEWVTVDQENDPDPFEDHREHAVLVFKEASA